MNEVYIDMRKENEWIKKYFDTDFVSIESLLNCIEDLDIKIDSLKEKIKLLQEDLKLTEPPTSDEWSGYWCQVGYDRAKGEK